MKRYEYMISDHALQKLLWNIKMSMLFFVLPYEVEASTTQTVYNFNEIQLNSHRDILSTILPIIS